MCFHIVACLEINIFQNPYVATRVNLMVNMKLKNVIPMHSHICNQSVRLNLHSTDLVPETKAIHE